MDDSFYLFDQIFFYLFIYKLYVDFTVDVSGGEDEEEKEKQITVKFARQESERMKRARERSFNFLSMKSAEEPWYNTNYYPSTSRESEVMFMIL